LWSAELNIPVQTQNCAATPVVSIFVSSPEGKEELDVAMFLETLGFVCMESKQLVNAELEISKEKLTTSKFTSPLQDS
jgi:hypothetical protein